MSTKKALVKEYMSQPVVFVGADFVLEQAEKIFHQHRLTAVPVLIDKKSVVGVLTDFQLLKLFLIRNSNPLKARLKDYQEDLDPVFLVDEDEEISQVFKMMIQSPNHRVFVTSNGKLIGALSPKDILPYLSGDAAAERHAEHKELIIARIENKRLSCQLAETKELLDSYEQVFMSSPSMIYSTDLEGVITMANPMLHQVLGYTNNELVGKNITEIYASQCHQQAMMGLAAVKTQGFHPLMNTLMVRKNKELLQTDLASSAKLGANGKVIGCITMGRLSHSGKMLDALTKIGEALKIDVQDKQETI